MEEGFYDYDGSGPQHTHEVWAYMQGKMGHYVWLLQMNLRLHGKDEL